LLLEQENNLAAHGGAVLLQVLQSTEDKEGLVILCRGSSQLLPSLHCCSYSFASQPCRSREHGSCLG